MNKPPTLKIIPFKNPAGWLAYRVTGMIASTRVQKNFPTQREAEGFMNGLIRAADQADSQSRERMTSTTFPTDASLRQAEAAYEQLQGAMPGESLLTAVNFFISNGSRVVRDALAEQALVDYLARRRARGNRERTIDVCEDVLRLFLRRHSIIRISDFTKEKAELFVFDSTIRLRTRRDRRAHLVQWSNYLVRQNYLPINFVEQVDRPRLQRGQPTTLSCAQVQTLLDVAAKEPVGKRKVVGAMLPYFAICVLSGMRPDETKRMKDDWELVSFEKSIIHGFIPKRPDKHRSVEIGENLKAILQACNDRGLAPGYFRTKAFNHIRKKAGLFDKWDNDILRHTYASHHYAWKRDLGYLVKNMGNSVDVLHQSYLNLGVLASEGEAFFKITCGI